MSHLEKIREAGAEEELNSTIAGFVKQGSDDDVKKLLAEIDTNGLKSPVVMKLIGRYQTSNVLKPGLYKKLSELNKKLGSNGQPAAKKEAAPKEEEAKAASTEATPTEDATKADPPADQEAGDEGTGESEEKSQFTAKQEEKIKERMKKEEAKMRERLLKKEQKIRERLANRAEKRAQRLGIKAEEAKEIQEKKEILATKREEYKTLREEIKTLRAEIKALRPKRSKSSDEERAFKVWTRKVARLEKRVEKWSESDDDKAPEKLATAEEKLTEAKAELEKATAAYEEWKANQPPPEEKTEEKTEDK